MKRQNLAWRVGLFVLVCLALLAGLVIRFSKGTSWFTPTYEILLKTGNVGGIQRGASVLMSGVPIGYVEELELTPDGRAVLLHLRILRKHSIRADASFYIEQAGFLGDQYISIVTGKNLAPPLAPGALVTCDEPFNLQEAARAATGFLRRADTTVQQLNDVVARLDRTLLSEASLTNVTITLTNFRAFSERVTQTTTRIDDLLASQTPAIDTGISNVVAFTRQLNALAEAAQATLATNAGQLTSALSNINHATLLANSLLEDLHAGRGLAGSLLRDDQLQSQWSQTASNLTVLSSNLNRFGLLYRPKPPKTNAPKTRLSNPPARPF